MPKTILVLSGRIASGKSSVAVWIAKQFGYCIVKTRDLLVAVHTKEQPTRASLQKLGTELDNTSGGQWVYDRLQEFMEQHPSAPGFVVDSVRIQQQIDIIRQHLRHRVTHVHLSAPEHILRDRFMRRASNAGDPHPDASYAEASRDLTESHVEDLARTADAVIDTSTSSAGDVTVRVASCLGLQSQADSRLVDVVVGGQFGSEGKGQICGYLGPEYDALVRTGGPNAGHKVFEDPKPYTFHLLPSATRVSQAMLIIGPGTTISAEVLLREISECSITRDRLVIDRRAFIIDQSDRDAEQQLVGSIGSTGQGVGWAASRRIRDRGKPVRLAEDMEELTPYVGDTLDTLEQLFRAGKRILVEGTQGTGLSIYHGHYPFVTSRDTTVCGVLSEAGIPPSRVNRVIMVVRSYPIRVESPSAGDSGPMSKEIDWQVISDRSGIPVEQLHNAERTSTTGRRRRVAEFDWALFRKACLLNGPTDIALTFVDYLAKPDGVARRFEDLSKETIRFIDELERCAQAPVSLISNGFGHLTVIDRRNWRASR